MSVLGRVHLSFRSALDVEMVARGSGKEMTRYVDDCPIGATYCFDAAFIKRCLGIFSLTSHCKFWSQLDVTRMN